MILPNYLFWDIDISTLDFEKNARFIIKRVIQKGSLKEWKIIKDFYSLDFIKNEILLIRDLDPKTFTFFSTYFGLNKNNFRCYTTQQSNPRHFN